MDMDNTLLITILTVLALSVALNLKLTFALQKSLRNLISEGALPFALPIGEKVPTVTGKRLSDKQVLTLPSETEASVFLFLSSTCPKCKSKFPEIENFLPLLADASLNLWLVSQEPSWRLKRFLRKSALTGHVLMVDSQAFKSLNPNQVSPYYLFLDHTACLEAAGLIGDENWLSFLEQMNEMKEMNLIEEGQAST